MTLKFKFFESDYLNILENDVNKFAEENKREITKDSIIKVYYNRTPIDYVLIKHEFATNRDDEIIAKKITNSVIIVWDKIERPTSETELKHQWEKDHLYNTEGKHIEKIDTLEKYESNLDDSYIKEYEYFLDRQRVEQHKQVILLLTEMLIKKHGYRDVDKIIEKLKDWGTLNPSHLPEGSINLQWVKYMVKTKVDEQKQQ